MAMNYKKKVLFLLILPAILLFLNRCRMGTNVYKDFPKGTVLSLDILKKAKQIIKNNHDIVLVINVSKSWDKSINYLLFFNASNILYSASYLPSIRVDSVFKGVLYATEKQTEDAIPRKYITDLPDGYSIHLSEKKVTAGGWECNKVIEQLNYKNDSIRMVIRKSDDLYACGGWNSDADTSAFFKNFKILDTLSYPLSELYIDYKSQLLMIPKNRDGYYLISDRFVVINKSNFDSLFYPILLNRQTTN